MTSPLENLYPDTDTSELVFSQPGPVSSGDQISHSLPVSASPVAPEPTEESELSELDDQPEVDTGDSERAISEHQNYRETLRGVCTFMGWTPIPDLEYSPASRTDNPWVGHRAHPVGKVSVLLPPKGWLCKKLGNLNLVLVEGYPSQVQQTGPSLHVDQFLRPPKSQSRWYGTRPAEPKDPTRPGKTVNTWLNDAAKLNSAFHRIVNHLLLLLNPLVAQFHKTLYENGRKQPRKPATYVISQLVSADASSKFRTVFKTTSRLYKLNYPRGYSIREHQA